MSHKTDKSLWILIIGLFLCFGLLSYRTAKEIQDRGKQKEEIVWRVEIDGQTWFADEEPITTPFSVSFIVKGKKKYFSRSENTLVCYQEIDLLEKKNDQELAAK